VQVLTRAFRTYVGLTLNSMMNVGVRVAGQGKVPVYSMYPNIGTPTDPKM